MVWLSEIGIVSLMSSEVDEVFLPPTFEDEVVTTEIGIVSLTGSEVDEVFPSPAVEDEVVTTGLKPHL